MATIGILALGFAYLPFIGSKETMLQAFLTLIPVFVTPLFTIYLIGIFSRAHAKSGIVGILVGACYGVIALVDREIFDIGWLPVWFTNRWAALIWAMVFTGLGAALVTLIYGPCRSKQVSLDQRGWLYSSSHSLTPLPEYHFDRLPSRWLSPERLAIALISVTTIILYSFFW